MALIATVSKKSVVLMMDKLWNVSLNLVLTDDSVEVINKDYALHYRPGDSVSAKRDVWLALMQADIDNYKSEQTIFDAVALDNVVTNLNGSLVV